MILNIYQSASFSHTPHLDSHNIINTRFTLLCADNSVATAVISNWNSVWRDAGCPPPSPPCNLLVIRPSWLHACMPSAPVPLLHFGSLHLCFQDFLSTRKQVNVGRTQKEFQRNSGDERPLSHYLFFIQHDRECSGEEEEEKINMKADMMKQSRLSCWARFWWIF